MNPWLQLASGLYGASLLAGPFLALWVFLDMPKRDWPREERDRGGWAFAVMFVAVLAFPAYLMKRDGLPLLATPWKRERWASPNDLDGRAR